MRIITDHLSTEVGKHLFLTATFTKPPTWWVALYTTLPNDVGAGGVEVSGLGYTRIEYAPGDARWSLVDEFYVNSTIIQFPAPTANWGTILGYGLLDLETLGTVSFKNQLLSALTVNSGEPAPFFPIGTLKIKIA